MSDHQGSPQLAAAVSRSEAEARIEAALKVLTAGRTVAIGHLTPSLTSNYEDGYCALRKAVTRAIAILEDGRS